MWTKRMQLKNITRILKKKLSDNVLNLAVIAVVLFFVMKITYWLAGDYESDYWHVLYNLAHYFVLVTVFLLIHSYMITKEHKVLFGFTAVFYIAMFLLQLACLFKISLYRDWVSGAGYYGVGALVLTIGITTIFIKIRKRHGRRNDPG